MQYFWDKLEQYGAGKALVQDDGRECTYEEMTELSRILSTMLMPRSVCLQLCSNTIASVAGYAGFLRNRVVPLLLDSALDETLLNKLMRLYRPRYMWLPQEERRQRKSLQSYEALYSYQGYDLLLLSSGPPYPLHDGLGVLLTTSGSTGSPKFVRQSYRNMEANAASICEYLAIDEKERPVTTLPMHYTYGLSVLHSHLRMGATVLLTSYPVVRREFWEFMKERKATSLSGVPYTYEVLRKVKCMQMDLPDLKVLTQAGGRLPVALQREFGDWAGKEGRKFIVMYGQTEATARMSYLPAEHCLDKCGSIGIPIPGGTFALVNEKGDEICQTQTDGELVYRGENVALGYAESAEDLSRGDDWGGVLYTGDIARKDADGYYYITGRRKRFLKLYGSRVNLDEIEQLVNQAFPHVDCAAVGTDERMRLYITDKDAIEKVKEFVVDKTRINALAVQVDYLAELPRNASGKILYGTLERKES